MVATVLSATLIGVDASPVTVEVDRSEGLPSFSIIGLGDAAVKEARYRVQCALRSCGIDPPARQTTVNLAPADLRKDGASLDLPIALGVLVQMGVVDEEALADTLAAGELGLDGTLRPIRGALAMAQLAQTRGYRRLLLPPANAREAAAVGRVAVLAPMTLERLLGHLSGHDPLEACRPSPLPPRDEREPDLADVRGQLSARRALEIAATGRLSLLMVGSPGCGKTMLARRLPSILPPLGERESIEVTKVWSAGGLTHGRGDLVRQRPFRAPHSTISPAGLVGGGHPIRPGEVSLAHRGVLFLDELAEMPRRVLETLRQPLEDHEVTIARARQSVRMPAAFMLVAATNPCPCGWYGHPERPCKCAEPERMRYRRRISGPMLDRMDLVVDAPAVPIDELIRAPAGEPSRPVRDRVKAGCEFAQRCRGQSVTGLSGHALWSAAGLSAEAQTLLRDAGQRLAFSARGTDRLLRVARTIADLESSSTVQEVHVEEALGYRESSLLAG